MASFVYDGDALLDEQAELLSSSTPFDINYVAFLRTKLAARQRLTIQRNQADHRAASASLARSDGVYPNTDHVRASVDLQSPEPHAQRPSVPSDPSADSPHGVGYRPFVAGGEAFATYGSQGSASRRGSAASSAQHRVGADWESGDHVSGPLAAPPPMTFDDVPASASARLELASTTNLGESLTTPVSYVRESRARSLADRGDAVRSSTVADSHAATSVSASLDDRVAVATGRPVVPDDAAAFAAGSPDAGGEESLVPCPHCGRTFVADRVDRHAALCAKQRAREAGKPKVDFIKSKRMMDLYGGEAVKLSASSTAPADRTHSKGADSLNNTWRRQSAQLRTAMSGGDTTGAGAGEYPVEDDRVQCPGCGRRFAKDVADRHVPLCVAKTNHV